VSKESLFRVSEGINPNILVSKMRLTLMMTNYDLSCPLKQTECREFSFMDMSIIKSFPKNRSGSIKCIHNAINPTTSDTSCRILPGNTTVSGGFGVLYLDLLDK
jgi:hypothetical protein